MILITGATGFIGSHLVKELYRRGCRMRCMVRDTRKAAHIKKSDVAIGDMRDFPSLLSAAKGCSAVIHLAAPIGHDDYKTNYDVTVSGTKHLIEACRRNGVKRIIFLSSIMAAIGQSNYGRTKLVAEKLLLKSGMGVAVLRGDWIYGNGDWGLSKLLKLIKMCPFIPVPGNGRYRKRPIYIDDAVKAIIACIHGKHTSGQTYMLGGPSIAYNEMLEILCENLGINKRKLHVPLRVLFLVASLLKIFGNRKVTKNNILGLTYDCSYDTSRTETELKLNPRRFEEGVKKCKDYYRHNPH